MTLLELLRRNLASRKLNSNPKTRKTGQKGIAMAPENATVTTTEEPKAAVAVGAKPEAKPAGKGKLAAAIAAKKKGKAAKGKGKPEVETTPIDDQPVGLEAMTSWKKLVDKRVPNNEDEAEALTDEALELSKAVDIARYQQGLIALTLGQRVKESTTNESKEKKAKRKASSSHNCFSLTKWKKEPEWAFHVGLADKRPDGTYNLNRLQQAKLQAQMHLQAIEAGVEEGAERFDRATLNVVGRSSKTFVKLVVPLMVEAAKKGKTEEEIRKLVEKEKSDFDSDRKEAAETRAAQTEDNSDKLYKQAYNKQHSVAEAFSREGGITDRLAGCKRYYDMAMKRKDLTPHQRKELETARAMLLRKVAAACKAIGLE